MEPQEEPPNHQKYDQVFMKKLRALYVSVFNNIQTEYDEADQFNHCMCLDFACHPKMDLFVSTPTIQDVKKTQSTTQKTRGQLQTLW
eukprot:TRINITY_DN3944_c0_g1_i2.p1 TRINITY_DN3944_c0_g1~~TRINITY_DN3944_c0_g1_i2.p1  ORF type:complete len:102 (+),score=17.88 TRINITY_DN3944_c0_g1_i2:48-308(+)